MRSIGRVGMCDAPTIAGEIAHLSETTARAAGAAKFNAEHAEFLLRTQRGLVLSASSAPPLRPPR